MYIGDEHKKPHLKTGLFSIIRTKVILVDAHAAVLVTYLPIIIRLPCVNYVFSCHEDRFFLQLNDLTL